MEASNRRPSEISYASGHSENAIVYGGYPDADVLLLAKPHRQKSIRQK